MKYLNLLTFSASLACIGLLILAIGNAPAPSSMPQPHAAAGESPEVSEARVRCRLLHETIHGSLQVVHRDFFRGAVARKGGNIPSKSLEDVFAELEKTWGVSVKWLAVDTEAMNPDHRPKSDFDQLAAKGIAEGLERYEAIDDGLFRYAGQITLGNQCLKCHVPDRTSLQDRKAAVVISMPVKLKEPGGK